MKESCGNLLLNGTAVPSSAQLDAWISDQYEAVLEDLQAIVKLQSIGSVEPVSQVEVNGIIRSVDNHRLMELSTLYYEGTRSSLLSDMKVALSTTSNMESLADRMIPLREAVRTRYLGAAMDSIALALKTDPIYKDISQNVLSNFAVMDLLTLQTDRLRPFVMITGDSSGAKGLLTSKFAEKLRSINHGFLHIGRLQYSTNVSALDEIFDKATTHQIAIGLRYELFRRALTQTLPMRSVVILDLAPQEFVLNSARDGRSTSDLAENAELDVRFLHHLLEFSAELRAKKNAILVVNIHSPLISKETVEVLREAILDRATIIHFDTLQAGSSR